MIVGAFDGLPPHTGIAESGSSLFDGSRRTYGVKAALACGIFIVMLGICAILLHQRTADFWGDDVFYADTASNLLHQGFYGVNGNFETTQPPGLAAILAGVFAVFGYSYAVCVETMAVFEMLGFLVAYEVLRQRAGSLIAATICIILVTSPDYFSWATRMVFAAFPYFFTTMFALLCGGEYDKAKTTRSAILWGTGFAIAVAASILIATATIALLLAIIAVIAVTAFKDLHLARRRFLRFLPILLIGIMVQGIWSHRKPAPLEWSLPGYPASYINQIKLKSGNYPELGMATLRDIPIRVTNNLLAESNVLAQIFLRHGVNPAKLAVVIVPVLLMTIGWVYSVWKSGGTDLVDWYFAAYQSVYLLWPWAMDRRFVLPIAPLAGYYIWQGIKGATFAAKTKPRVTACIWFPIGLLLFASGVRWLFAHRGSGFGDWPDELLIPFWLISAVYALLIAYLGESRLSAGLSLRLTQWFRQPQGALRLRALQFIELVCIFLVIGLILVGIVGDARIARENLETTGGENTEKTAASELLVPDVEAGLWLRAHTASDSVAMARSWPTVFHYAQRKVVWFAPISDANILFEGIIRNRVDYIVVVKHPDPVYLPGEDYCFNQLVKAYAGNFQLVMQENTIQIYKFQKDLRRL